MTNVSYATVQYSVFYFFSIFTLKTSSYISASYTLNYVPGTGYCSPIYSKTRVKINRLKKIHTFYATPLVCFSGESHQVHLEYQVTWVNWQDRLQNVPPKSHRISSWRCETLKRWKVHKGFTLWTKTNKMKTGRTKPPYFRCTWTEVACV